MKRKPASSNAPRVLQLIFEAMALAKPDPSRPRCREVGLAWVISLAPSRAAAPRAVNAPRHHANEGMESTYTSVEDSILPIRKVFAKRSDDRPMSVGTWEKSHEPPRRLGLLSATRRHAFRSEIGLLPLRVLYFLKCAARPDFYENRCENKKGTAIAGTDSAGQLQMLYGRCLWIFGRLKQLDRPYAAVTNINYLPRSPARGRRRNRWRLSRPTLVDP